MTREEYAYGLLDMLKRGWTYTVDNLQTRYEMGMAETLWLMRVPEKDRADYFAFARKRIWLDLGGKKITLQEYLGSF